MATRTQTNIARIVHTFTREEVIRAVQQVLIPTNPQQLVKTELTAEGVSFMFEFVENRPFAEPPISDEP